ncbi:ABC transporter substrate-binding protein [Sphingomonas montanisoli]|uniref:ABC transporter substrate-binding protein n=1 Tax=Sphingomonas montanisoli TaxID=2606412 RepID=A0A5D9C6C6_9SPHN|nr:ABC transporter substrate-binding protein [Sphingomonas montanisoli]TZG27354.1 ABC transporter substrate-binding protein [Sphingomonas montanisoli]
MKSLSLLPLVALLIAGCQRKADDGPVAVSVIGDAPRLVEKRVASIGAPRAALLGAVAQGLVRFDAKAEIEPGLAIRWAISEDGLYYTFRLDADGPTADKIAAALRRRIAAQRGGPLAYVFDAIDEIVAVTPEVIEIRLNAPRADLMTILARPELALIFDGQGLGPLRMAETHGPSHALKLLPPPRPEDADAAAAPDRRFVLLRGERAALGVARFQRGELRLLTGGTVADLIYPRLAGFAEPILQADPATGLFGLRVTSNAPMLASIEVRQALAASLDRDAIGVALQAPGWRSTDSIFPGGTLATAANAGTAQRPLLARAIAGIARNRGGNDQIRPAAEVIRSWRAANEGSAAPLKLALPAGPGGRALFAAIATQWARIGVRLERVVPDATADLTLVDEVAPSDEPEWFLTRFLCAAGRPCSKMADESYARALQATDPAIRDAALAEAAERIAALHPFIPIAQPLRWSLVVANSTGFTANPRAIHPLAPLIRR